MAAPAKLPLLVRKNIKDEFDAKKGDLEKRYKDLFGEDYKLEADFPTLYAQGDDGYQRDSIGTVVYEAMDGACRYISDGTNKGQDKILIDGFNENVSSRIITVVMDSDFKGSYSGCRVKDGKWEILFKPKGLGTNSYSASEYWKEALNEASAKANPKGLPPIAKAGIKKDYEDKIGELEKKISESLNGEKLTCKVDFEDIWSKIIDAHEALPAKKKGDLDIPNLARRLGAAVYDYFNSLRDKVERELNDDELMIEGFFDEVSTKEAWFGLVPETESLKNSYTDTSIEDGKLWSKSKPTKFGINVDTGFEGLSKLL